MSGKVIIAEVASLMEYRGSCAPSLVEFRHGEFAVDALGLATSGELFAVLRPLVGEAVAKSIVEPLLEHGLLFDEIIDGMVVNEPR